MKCFSGFGFLVVCSGQPIVCPSLNPSDVLEDNCTGLLAGQLLGSDKTSCSGFRVQGFRDLGV